MTIEHAKSQARIKEFSFEEIEDQEGLAVGCIVESVLIDSKQQIPLYLWH